MSKTLKSAKIERIPDDEVDVWGVDVQLSDGTFFFITDPSEKNDAAVDLTPYIKREICLQLGATDSSVENWNTESCEYFIKLRLRTAQEEFVKVIDGIVEGLEESTSDASPIFESTGAIVAPLAREGDASIKDSAAGESLIKDSGHRREFESGAVRDRGADDKVKGAYDLLSPFAFARAAIHMERGARKYAARNWEKGMPLSEYYNSAMRHMLKFAVGLDDEDHLAAAFWNVHCLIHTKEMIDAGDLPAELDDLPVWSEKAKNRLLELTGEEVEKKEEEEKPLNEPQYNICQKECMMCPNTVVEGAKYVRIFAGKLCRQHHPSKCVDCANVPTCVHSGTFACENFELN